MARKDKLILEKKSWCMTGNPSLSFDYCGKIRKLQRPDFSFACGLAIGAAHPTNTRGVSEALLTDLARRKTKPG